MLLQTSQYGKEAIQKFSCLISFYEVLGLTNQKFSVPPEIVNLDIYNCKFHEIALNFIPHCYKYIKA